MTDESDRELFLEQASLLIKVGDADSLGKLITKSKGVWQLELGRLGSVEQCLDDPAKVDFAEQVDIASYANILLGRCTSVILDHLIKQAIKKGDQSLLGVMLDSGLPHDITFRREFYCSTREHGAFSLPSLNLAHLALLESQADLARYLVIRGVGSDLRVASGTGDIDSMERLLDSSNRLQALSAYDAIEIVRQVRIELSEPFLYACMNGQLESAFFLIRRGADINFQSEKLDACSASGLHWACRNGHGELVRFLINYGADMHKCDFVSGARPAKWALDYGHARISEYIEHLRGAAR